MNKHLGHHLLGKNGCPICKNKGHSWSRSQYIERCGNKECLLYIIKCFNETEEFYKIGITSKSVKERFYGKVSIPYEYEILKIIKGNAEQIWDLENHYKYKIFNIYKYIPKIKFSGYTECFQIPISEINILLFMNNT